MSENIEVSNGTSANVIDIAELIDKIEKLETEFKKFTSTKNGVVIKNNTTEVKQKNGKTNEITTPLAVQTSSAIPSNKAFLIQIIAMLFQSQEFDASGIPTKTAAMRAISRGQVLWAAMQEQGIV